MATKWQEMDEVPAPVALARDARLPIARRRAILSEWAVSLADRELADREDGIRRTPADVRRDRALLTAVNDALAELDAHSAVKEPGPLRWFAKLIGA